MWLDTCAMLNKLQKNCWPDNIDFVIQDIECISYIARGAAKSDWFEGMITVSYRPHTPMEQDILVGILLTMHIGNDIPDGEKGSGSKWCPLRNTLAYTACTVTRVSARRTTRGHYRQDISILEKIRAASWKTRPPNIRQIIQGCEERDDPWEDIPQEDCVSETSEDTAPPWKDTSREDPFPPPRSQPLWKQRDLPNWQNLISSSLEELKRAHQGQYEEAGLTPQDPENPPRPGTANTQELSKLLHTLHYDPAGRQATTAYFNTLSRDGYSTLATEGHKIIRNIVAGEAETVALRGWIHRLNTTTGDNNTRRKVTVTTQNMGPSGIFRAMHVIADTLTMKPLVS